MKRVYANSQYAKPCERYCREVYPDEGEQIFKKVEAYYLKFMKDMPDLGENMMAKNMLDWFTILALYEASDIAWMVKRCLKSSAVRLKR